MNIKKKNFIEKRYREAYVKDFMIKVCRWGPICPCNRLCFQVLSPGRVAQPTVSNTIFLKQFEGAAVIHLEKNSKMAARRGGYFLRSKIESRIGNRRSSCGSNMGNDQRSGVGNFKNAIQKQPTLYIALSIGLTVFETRCLKIVIIHLDADSLKRRFRCRWT